MLAKFNILDWYPDKSLRRWDNTDNQHQFLPLLVTGKIPMLHFIFESATSASLELNNIDDGVVDTVPMTIESATNYKRLIYKGKTLPGQEDGYYYLKLTVDGVGWYSDVFGWVGGPAGLLHVKASGLSNFDLGNSYLFNMDGFEYECYLSAEYLGITPEIDEDAEDVNGVIKTTYGNRSIVRKFEIYAHEFIYVFLSGLRVLTGNGTVTITWNGIEYSADDIEVSTGDELVEGDICKISLQFKVINETISVNNAIS